MLQTASALPAFGAFRLGKRCAPGRLVKSLMALAAVVGCASVAMAAEGPESVAAAPQSNAAATEPIDFHEQIEPILAKSCYSCHGADYAEASLRLDAKAEAMRGGNSGPAIVPGKSEESRLVHFVTGENEDGMIMPPEGEPLSETEIALVRNWIDQGALWPAEEISDAPQTSDHWSLQPITDPAPPAVAHATAVRNGIDNFIIARLEKEGLEPSVEADREMLIRRLSLDLTGLPPRPEEVQEFLADNRSDAYERLVDRLLASPHYGEKWARHWLDQGRYADSDGYEKDTGRPHAWRWRNWVIDALNADMPFDEFTRQQLAGDLLPGEEQSHLVATGFHRNTLTNKEGGVDQEEFRVAAVIDRVNTTGSVWLGLTVGCAQCHTHKYDPITQMEYYRLFAFFNNCDEQDVPAPLPEQVTEYEQALAQWQTEHAPLAEALATFEREQLPGRQRTWEAQRLADISAPEWTVLTPATAKATSDVELTVLDDGSVLASGPRPAKTTYTIVAHLPEGMISGLRLELLPDESLPKAGPGRGNKGEFQLTELTLAIRPLDKQHPKSKATPELITLAYPLAEAEAADAKKPVAAAVDGDRKTAWQPSVASGAPSSAYFELARAVGFEGGTQLTVTLAHDIGFSIGRLRLSVTQAEPPLRVAGMEHPIATILDMPAERRSKPQQRQLAAYYRLRDSGQQDSELARLSEAVEAHAKKKPVDPATKVLAQALIERQQDRRTTHVLVRGDFLRPGAVVEPGVLAVLPDLKPRGEQPDRLDLANWLVSKDNPLTARVKVNRVWMLYFGRGLVATQDDFGTQGEKPSHGQLLDWLASRFMEQGWSLKALHRLIVTSATYRQSSVTPPELLERDPYNILLARQSRVRVQAEVVRDLALAVSGLLVPEIGGPSVRPPQPAGVTELTYAGGARWVDSKGDDRYRRGLYTWFQRTSPYPMLLTFDAPDANVACTRRERSNTPLQALTLLNDPVFVECAQMLARRIVSEAPVESADGKLAVDARLQYAMLLCLGRHADGEELQMLRELYQSQLELAKADLQAVEQLIGPRDRHGASVEELAAYAIVGRTLMNLDEFITRE